MKAVIFKEHGDIDQLIYIDVPEPKIGPDEILVRVRACALNHLDIWTRLGMPGVPIPLPHILGCDIAGEISKIGANVKNLKASERVVLAPGISCGSCAWCLSGWDSLCARFQIIGLQVDGGYAEFVKVPARNVIPVSSRLSWEEWAACPLVFLTAWHMLVTRAELKKGERVLIHAAGSGVGSAAIQIAKWIGAEVLTTIGSEEKEKCAKQLGANHVINYRKTDFSKEVRRLTENRGVEVVLEHTGTETFAQSLATLSRKGRLVTCGVTSGASTSIDIRFLFIHQLSILGCYMGGCKELDRVLELIESGVFKPIVDSVFPLADAKAAQKRMLERKNFGKIVLKT